MIIYKIICMVNNKVYIGQTTESLKLRFKRHMGYQKNNYDTKFYRAVRKYGVENFCIEELARATSKEELNILEEKYIKDFNSISDGYNTALGKIGGDTLSMNPNLDAIKKKLSTGKIGGKNPNSTKILCKNIYTLESKEYDSMADCQREMTIPRHDIIRRRCLGEIKKPYREVYMFEYL